MLLAYFCWYCNLLFWLHEDSIHDENELAFAEEFNQIKVRCPHCRNYQTIRREDTSDEEVDLGIL